MTNRVEMYLEYKRELCALIGGESTITEQDAENDVYYATHSEDAKWIAVEDNNEEIGFIILGFGRNLMRGAGEPTVDYFIQETYIRPEYRRKGIMTKEVEKLLDQHKGIYGLYILSKNKPALAFWHTIIKDRWINVDNLGSDEDGKEYAFDNRERELDD